MVRPRVFFDFSIDNVAAGRVIFELFNDTVPKTCENFRALCTGEKGLSPISSDRLYYKNSIIHRSIKGFMIQGGDFTKRNGTGGDSIYGGPFSDEDLTRPLDSEGLLCMANKGPNTNNSQFFVTLRACPHLNGKHVVFGRDRPAVPVTITNCGELMLRTQAQPKQPESKSTAASEPESSSELSDEEKRRHRKKRRHRDESSERRHHHKNKSKHKSKKARSPSHSPAEGEKKQEAPADPQEETEEQYDARLEREEKERLEAARKRELERIKRRVEESSQARGGVRLKGRGRMKFIDPELHRDRRDD
ncbi:Peptidyl-prolyl cis-trans isomerase cyp11 [Grifola frondosa]|uniref:peptidylprolyl isomerase n=1 Tax=Grifola frondosa TaxID=5627 RepID=A0A1C7M6U2_GRIFR|nr:Peptidyl-prolyl cis-trans isomerase cyp11 [Grifola frondosa]